MEINDVKQGVDILKFIKGPPTKMVWSCWKNEKPKIPKQIAAVTMERTRESKRPRKRWKSEVANNGSKMGI
jgi:hypothetical protein